MTEKKGRGGPRPGAGRPAPPGGRRKLRSFKANDIEWQQMQEKAKEAGITASDYIRQKALQD